MFKQVKKDIVSDNVITYYNPNLPLKLMYDASLSDIEYVLLHIFFGRIERPIVFASRVGTYSDLNKVLSNPQRGFRRILGH